ncbi:hypothetical protein FN846DRAFT_786779 [Sphaerosporella brunnea]|uniref:Cyclin-domain-containing protein n=1 Tax=Sphaerosporella brunnea TaxID=1250544 RepID=A0A5J5EH01_9PEZI|nr:hypothetical protein FN846DRAFT_786779 [Sphaerosporella brunnea]
MTLVAAPQAISFHSSSPTPSVASVSSGTSSIWSVQSSTSSNATSVSSSTIDSFSVPSTTVLPHVSTITGPELSRRATAPTPRGYVDQNGVRHLHPCPAPVDIPPQPLPIEQRQNPRRTNRLVEGQPQQCPGSEGCVMPPVPTLQRQADRKVNFVENLVDSAAQIVETIWQPPKYIASQVGAKDAVLPLRTFIQETLRRSRTSYSTLQVALYYLIVIRPHLPGMDCDVSDLDPEETQLVRAKQCGRRMFLAALILASKYLQDRNYSARAWSKISGLNTQEINVNEMAFLKAVDWKLHISEVVFQRWTDLVLKYTSTPSPSPVSPTRSSLWSDEEHRKREWCELILRLSPDLREVESAIAEPTPARPLTPKIEFGPPIESVQRGTAPPALRKTNSMPAPGLPPRTLEPQLQHNNAFRALHPALPPISVQLPMAPPPCRPSPCQRAISAIVPGISTPAASPDVRYRPGNSALAKITPKIGGAMASVARSAMSSALSGCSQEAYPSAGVSRRRSDANVAAEPSARKSSLSTCLSTRDESEFVPRAPAFKRQDSSEMHRLAMKCSAAVPAVFVAPLPPLADSRLAPMLVPIPQQPSRLVMASPKSTEAALTLHMLREASSSPATTVGSLTPTTSSAGRKRSCPSVTDNSTFLSGGSSGVTPKFRGLAGFGSPSLRCAGSPVMGGSPSLGERCGKRARSSWEMDSLVGGVAQGVR